MRSSIITRGTLALAGFVVLTLASASACLATDGGYIQTNLVSDIPGMAPVTDSRLVNPWGIFVSSGPDADIWVSDNGTGLSTVYRQNGCPEQTEITIPPPAGTTGTAAPTGLVRNTTFDFDIQNNRRSLPAVFIYATEDGTVAGWNPLIDKRNAILALDNSGAHSVFKGIALATTCKGSFLFVTDFHNGVVTILNKNYTPIKSFSDPDLPPPPIGTPGFAPFGIRNIGGLIYVTYALQDADQHDDVAGVGNGFVDVFDTDGNLIRRFASGGTLNSPWGLALAPRNFGVFSGALLVGNFGDGFINAFNPTTGDFLGQISDPSGNPISIDGLWGITFQTGFSIKPAKLYFAAGLNHEADGLMGFLAPE